MRKLAGWWEGGDEARKNVARVPRVMAGGRGAGAQGRRGSGGNYVSLRFNGDSIAAYKFLAGGPVSFLSSNEHSRCLLYKLAINRSFVYASLTGTWELKISAEI